MSESVHLNIERHSAGLGEANNSPEFEIEITNYVDGRGSVGPAQLGVLAHHLNDVLLRGGQLGDGVAGLDPLL